MPSREYKRAEWLAADLDALARMAPRFAVAYEAAIPELDSVAWFEARGYLRRATFGLFVILERAPVARALSTR